MINRLKNWLSQKNGNERVLYVALIVLTPFILYRFGLYLPLSRAVDTLQLRCQKLKRDTDWLEKQASGRGLLPIRNGAKTLVNAVVADAKQAGLTVKISQKDETLEVAAAAIDVEAFMSWLWQLQLEKGLPIDTLEFHASKQGDSSIILTRMTLPLGTRGK